MTDDGLRQPECRSPRGAPLYFWVIAGFLSAAVVVPIWRCDYFPSQNGPQILSLAFIEKELDNPEYGFSEFYEYHPFPIPNRLQIVVSKVLLSFFSPVIVDKLLVSLLVLSRPWAMFYFLRGLSPGKEIYGLVSFAFAYDFPLMHGYYNFCAGVSIGLLVFGYYLRHRDGWRVHSLIVFNLLTLLLYFAHAWAVSITGLVLALFEFAATRSPARIVGIVLRGFVPSLMLLTAYVFWSAQVGVWAELEWGFQNITDKVYSLYFRGSTPLSPFANLASLALLGTITVAGVLVLLCRYGRWSFKRIDVDSAICAREPMLTVVLALGGMYLLAPWSFLTWHHLDVRFLIFTFALAPAIPPAIRHPWVRGGVILGISIVVLAGLLPIAECMRSISDEIVEYTAGIDSVPSQSKILPLFCNQPGSNFDEIALQDVNRPIKGGNAYYVMARGGATERGFARLNTLFCVSYKDLKSASHPRFPSVDADRPEPAQLDACALEYDAILIWNDDGSLSKQFLQRGFSVAFQRGRLRVLIKSSPTQGAACFGALSGPKCVFRTRDAAVQRPWKMARLSSAT